LRYRPIFGFKTLTLDSFSHIMLQINSAQFLYQVLAGNRISSAQIYFALDGVGETRRTEGFLQNIDLRF